MPPRQQQKKEQATAVEELQQFAVDSKNFFDKCSRPTPQQYNQIVQAVFRGFLVMGFIGYIIKLVFIPINNIILSN